MFNQNIAHLSQAATSKSTLVVLPLWHRVNKQLISTEEQNFKDT